VDAGVKESLRTGENVLLSLVRQVWIIFQDANEQIASVAQQSSNSFAFVAVIDYNADFRPATNGAYAILHFLQFLKAIIGNAVSLIESMVSFDLWWNVSLSPARFAVTRSWWLLIRCRIAHLAMPWRFYFRNIAGLVAQQTTFGAGLASAYLLIT
jgi:hypothetical protein